MKHRAEPCKTSAVKILHLSGVCSSAERPSIAVTDDVAAAALATATPRKNSGVKDIGKAREKRFLLQAISHSK
jgi:hypothetical protein